MILGTVLTPCDERNMTLAAQCGVEGVVYRYPGRGVDAIRAVQAQLDDYDLATRLSFFLTSSPPDTLLQKLANKGQLSDQTVLEEQTRRLLKDKGVKNFLTSFTGQWLNLRILSDIMPDSRLLKWTDKHTNAITAETELFVS